MKILLITGWGGGTKLLYSLKDVLVSNGFDVKLINIFNAYDETVLAHYTSLAQDYDVIMGWSLGGQLATVLVDQIQRQFQQQKVLITLASNPCFVENSEWQPAMSQETFINFKQSFERDAIATLKKFGYMVCQGVVTSKADFVTLQSLIEPQQLTLLEHGLVLLEKLNLVNILKNYQGFQYHLLSEQDVLVDCKVSVKLHQLGAKFTDVDVISGSHGFPVFQSALVTDKICHYLQKIKQSH
nr:hydrolase [Acinetobacter sp. Marseille-Q1620]